MRLAGLILARTTQGEMPFIYPSSVSSQYSHYLISSLCVRGFHVTLAFFLFYIPLFGPGFVYSIIRARTVAQKRSKATKNINYISLRSGLVGPF